MTNDRSNQKHNISLPELPAESVQRETKANRGSPELERPFSGTPPWWR